MNSFSSRVLVNHPSWFTYQLFLDERLMPQWISGFQSIEIVMGAPRQAGSMYRLRIRYQDEDVTVYYKLLQAEPHQRLTLEMEHRQFKTHSVICFEGTGNVTELGYRVKIFPKNLKVRLAMPFLKGLLQNRSQWDYHMFKKIAEKQTRPAASGSLLQNLF
ncbi:MAG: hypothetical protein KatS3mg031_0611 [Chitinophagales bacterium]|nr:MAG: hypothetical protein KatS3mg031_0611 [Chitinophagales bacterium]